MLCVVSLVVAKRREGCCDVRKNRVTSKNVRVRGLVCRQLFSCCMLSGCFAARSTIPNSKDTSTIYISSHRSTMEQPAVAIRTPVVPEKTEEKPEKKTDQEQQAQNAFEAERKILLKK